MPNNIAQRIKNLRRDKGLTLEQVAEVVGVGKSTVRKWETGMISNMKQDKIALLAKALGTTPEYLMGWDTQSQIDSLSFEIAQINKEIITASPDQREELEARLALLEESYDDLLFAQQMTQTANKKSSPDEAQLTEGEKAMLELFRQVPKDQQQLVLQMIRAALNTPK